MIASSNRKNVPTHCYLCGHPLSKPTSKDHCPPKALFAPEIRRRFKTTELDTIQVHHGCNSNYALDEEYFIATLAPLAPGSAAGNAVFRRFVTDARKGGGKQTLSEVILKEFELRPSGLHLPSGLVVKRQDGERIRRVAWKIVRGLYFLHHPMILPESLFVGCTVTAPGRRPPDHFLCVRYLDSATRGTYPGVFDYFFHTLDTDFGTLNYWAFLIWDRIIVTVYFHDPWSCPCDNCISAVAEMEIRARSPTP